MAKPRSILSSRRRSLHALYMVFNGHQFTYFLSRYLRNFFDFDFIELYDVTTGVTSVNS
jgi:hypothetical protein